MATAAGGSRDGNGTPPTKKSIKKIGCHYQEAEPPMKDLCKQYINILAYMLQYYDEYLVYPNACSSKFHRFVRKIAPENDHISPRRLTRAIVFLENTFKKNVRDRGINANYYNLHLRYRFELSKLIWGTADLEVNHEILDEEAQIDMDIGILRAVNEFRIANGTGEIPGADSVEFYEFLVALPGFGDIKQDRLVDRMLVLEENFKDPVEIVEIDAADATRQEIYYLSLRIWGGDQHGVQVSDANDNQDENAGDDQEEYAGEDQDENAGNDQDGNSDVANAGSDDEYEGVEEDDAGSDSELNSITFFG